MLSKKEQEEQLKNLNSCKITLRLEKEGKYVEKKLTWREICALFDLQYMLDDAVWETLKLNGFTRQISSFFKKIEYIDDAMHGDHNWIYNKKSKKMIKKKKEDSEYLFGKPEWKNINTPKTK